jgi:predicted HTH transcriptional regulator
VVLQEILFGTFTPPAISSTRFHYIDDRAKPIETNTRFRKYRHVVDKELMTDYQKRVLMIVKCNQQITKEDLAKKTKVSTNHAGTTLTSLYQAGLINRIKVQTGKKWMYAYQKK